MTKRKTDMAELNAKSQSKISQFFGKRSRESSEKSDDRNNDQNPNDQSEDTNFSEIVNLSENPEGNGDETDDQDRTAKKKKPHVYLESWKTNRPWLFTNDKKEMFCKFCLDAGKDNAFTTGNTNYRTSTLDRHVELQSHKQAIIDLKRSEQFKTSQLNAFSKKQEALQRAMSVVYWLAKENVASLKFGSMVDFLDFHGVDIGSLNVGNNATYNSRASVDEFQECMAEVIENDLLKKVSATPFFSILTDESTDISNSKKVVIYIRLIDPDTFVASTHFLGNVTVEGSSATAEILFDLILRFLKSKNIEMEKLIGFGSDGASVMVGKKSGVATRFKEICPHLINIHCMAHRFNLCTSQASRYIPYIKDTFEKVFKDIFYYFEKSANRTAELKEIQKVLESPQLKVREVHEIRWLAFYDALYAVYHSWKALVSYFTKNNKSQTCKDLLDKITDYRFVSLLHIMMDIIPHLSQLSLVLQKSDLDIASVTPAIDNINHMLKRVDEKKSHYQTLLGDQLKSVKDKEEVTFKDTLLHIHRSTIKKATDDIASIRHDFVTSLTDQIKLRFPKDSTDIAVSFGVFGLRNLTFLSADEFDKCGEKQIKLLADFYGKEQKSKECTSPPLVQHSNVFPEWTLAKNVIKREMYPRDNMGQLWQIMKKHHSETFPNILKLAAAALVMPFQTADCERGFSKQNIIKSPARNRLEGPSLQQLMMIGIEGPPLKEFDFKRAVMVWRSKKERRLFKN